MLGINDIIFIQPFTRFHKPAHLKIKFQHRVTVFKLTVFLQEFFKLPIQAHQGKHKLRNIFMVLVLLTGPLVIQQNPAASGQLPCELSVMLFYNLFHGMKIFLI